jgi:hypothetical protein
MRDPKVPDQDVSWIRSLKIFWVNVLRLTILWTLSFLGTKFGEAWKVPVVIARNRRSVFELSSVVTMHWIYHQKKKDFQDFKMSSFVESKERKFFFVKIKTRFHSFSFSKENTLNQVINHICLKKRRSWILSGDHSEATRKFRVKFRVKLQEIYIVIWRGGKTSIKL